MKEKNQNCEMENVMTKQEQYTLQNKKAWEYNVYNFWIKTAGTPLERANQILKNPQGMLKRYVNYFDSYQGVKIANICGSCGKKAIPLAVLGADVTVFDISEENKRYALEVAKFANVKINYEVCDVLKFNRDQYFNYFDVVFMEGGILHFFQDIDEFMNVMYLLLQPNGKMICSDFHPFSKITDSIGAKQPDGNYFSTEIFEGEMAHAKFYEDEIRKQIPLCAYRRYTISEIINSVLRHNFILKAFDEHPAWANEKIPGEFTIIANKEEHIG